MNRRYFFQSAAAGFGATFGAAPNDRIRIAIVGVRGRGRALAGGFARLPEVDIAYFAEVDANVVKPALDAVAKAGRKPPAVVADMRRAFDDPNVDAVVIATPDHWHAPAAILACLAGKDVYLEKPCSHNIQEGRLLVETARRSGRIIQHGTQGRSREITRQAIAYVHSGKLGKVLMAKAWNVQLRRDIGRKPDSAPPEGLDYDAWVGPAPWLPFNENRFHYNWHWHWNFGTGDIGNDGAHQIDMARWALQVDYPLEAAGMAGKIFFQDDQQTPDTMTIAYRYPGGKMLLFEMRIWNPYAMEGIENGVAVYGSEGMIHIGKWDRQWGYKVFDRRGKEAVFEQSAGEDEGHLKNFVECLKTRRKPNADIETGHVSVVHCHLGNIIARTGRSVRFDAATETIPGDAEAAKLTGRQYRKHWGTPPGVSIAGVAERKAD